MARLIDANELKQLILAERDKIPLTLPGAIYELRIAKTNHHGNAMRGGIGKALRCMEQCKTVDAVPVVRCKYCKRWHRHTEVDRERGECRRYQTTKHENGYCDRGERKDNG